MMQHRKFILAAVATLIGVQPAFSQSTLGNRPVGLDNPARISAANRDLEQRARERPNEVIRGQALLTRTMNVSEIRELLPKLALPSVAYRHVVGKTAGIYLRHDNVSVDEALSAFQETHNHALKKLIAHSESMVRKPDSSDPSNLLQLKQALKEARAMGDEHARKGLQIIAVDFKGPAQAMVQMRNQHNGFLRVIEIVKPGRTTLTPRPQKK